MPGVIARCIVACDGNAGWRRRSKSFVSLIPNNSPRNHRRGRCARHGLFLLPVFVLLGGSASAAWCQQAEAEVQRLMEQSAAERDRQSDAFALQLLQQQRLLGARPESWEAAVARDAQAQREFLRLLDEQRAAGRTAPAVGWGPRLDTRAAEARERQAELQRLHAVP